MSSIYSYASFSITATLLWVAIVVSVRADHAYLDTGRTQQKVVVASWKSLRDESVVKQDLDFSCGAASLATLLNAYYGESITEQEILEAMDKEDMKASFKDMADVLKQYGYRGVGYAVSFEQLSTLKIPVIVYTEHRKNSHFSVVRGIDAQTVSVADPSLGNRTYSKAQFLNMWETRDDAQLKGRILAILPAGDKALPVSDFFTRKPKRLSAAAMQQVVFRPGL